MKMPPFRIPGLLAMCFLVGACAGISYTKVPTPTQYDEWSDKDQQKADAMEGVRYYLPRPFLHLKQSVPVAQRVAFITLRLNPTTRQYELMPPEDAPSWVARVAPKTLSITQALAATLASAPVPSKGDLAQESGAPGATGSDTPEPPATPPAPPSTLKATTGFINATDPVTKLSDKMDIVYLPDFEEQYVIQPSTGFGQADIETRLRNGWAAEVFTQQVDNSNLIPYVIKQVESASEAAAGIVTTWAMKGATGVAPADLKNLKAGGLLQESGGVDADAAENLLGNMLVFKIAEVKIAQPGVYPILKPREVRQWLKAGGIISGQDPEETFELFLQQAHVPWIRPDMAFIPCPPFTMIGFNVTTDVFLAPATERVTTTALDGDGSGAAAERAEKEAAEKARGTIQEALFATRASGPDPVKDLAKQGIAPAANPAGNQTIVELQAPLSQAFVAGSAQRYSDWVLESLGLNDADPAVQATANVEARKLTVTIDLSMSEIVKRLAEK